MLRVLLATLCAVCMLCGSVSPSLAQIPPQRARIRGNGLVNNLRWLQFQVVSGRVVFNGGQQLGRTVSSSSKSNGREESLSISMADGVTVFRYELGTQEERVEISGKNGLELEVRREPRGDSKAPLLTFKQDALGRLLLTVQDTVDSPPRRETARSLWHLALAEPRLTQQELFPLMELIQTDWKLVDLATKLEPAMLRAALLPRTANRRAWTELVAQLSHDRYAMRESADRQLRAAGPAVAPFLENLDLEPLNAEQRLRIRRISVALRPNSIDDTPDVIARWLAWDPKAWFPLLSRDDPATRAEAARQLESLLEDKLDFDPAGDAATRQEQLARLHSRFALAPPAEEEPARE